MSEEIELDEPSVARSIAGLHTKAPGSVGDLFEFQVLEECREKGEYTLRCKTQVWMQNVIGTLHGGMCATIVDQAMGFVAFSYLCGKGNAPTIQLQLNYHKPLVPGEDVIVHIRVVSVTKNLISMTCEASRASDPDRICLTASATSFLKRTAE